MTGRRWQPAQISLTSYGGPNGPPPTRAIISAWDLFLLMRKQQPTPVEPGTNSTEADAVHVAGKRPVRKVRLTFSSN